MQIKLFFGLKLCRQMSRGWEGTKHKLDKRYDKSNEQI